MDNLSFRKADVTDCERIFDLLEQIADLHYAGRPDIFVCGRRKYDFKDFAAILSDPSKPIYVALSDKDFLVAYAFCIIKISEEKGILREQKTLFVDDFCVDENWRRQGIGESLFEFLKGEASALGISSVQLNVWEFNQSAFEFYEKLGFKTQSRKMELIL